MFQYIEIIYTLYVILKIVDICWFCILEKIRIKKQINLNNWAKTPSSFSQPIFKSDINNFLTVSHLYHFKKRQKVTLIF
jgi:hypothetical protein